MELVVGDRVDRYVVEERLGEGAMAVVYRVRHRHLRSLHALKVLRSAAPNVRRRTLLEGRVQAGLRHPHVVAVTDVLELADRVALVLEYVNGPTLDAYLRDSKPSTEQRLELFHRVLLGVAAAHSAGLVHRDLKPQNILLAHTNMGPQPKVADFGLVKTRAPSVTRTGALLGTPGYMSPEQIMDSAAVDARSDVWALGVMLYVILSDRLPFDAPLQVDLFRQVCSGVFTPLAELRPDLPAYLSEAIADALKVDPRERLQSVTALITRLYPHAVALVSLDDELGLGTDATLTTVPVILPAEVTTPIGSPHRVGVQVPGVSLLMEPESPSLTQPIHRAAAVRGPGGTPWTPRPRVHVPVVQPAPKSDAVRLLLLSASILVFAVLISRLLFPTVGARSARLIVVGVGNDVPVIVRIDGQDHAVEDFQVPLETTGALEITWWAGEGCDPARCPPICASTCRSGTTVVPAGPSVRMLDLSAP